MKLQLTSVFVLIQLASFSKFPGLIWNKYVKKGQIIVIRNNCRRQEYLEGTFEDTKQYLEAVNQRWTYVYKYHGQKKKAKKTNNDLHHTTQKTKDWAAQTALKIRTEFSCSGRENSSCPH